jgi:hypothetical protein
MKLGFGGSVLPVLAALPALPAIIAVGCLAVLGCSGAPSARTPAGHADGAAPSSQKSAPVTSGAPHGSEAEPRPAPATSTDTAPAAAATSGPATSAAASAARAPVAPLPPVVTTSAPAAAGAPGAAAATGTAAARAPGAAAAAPASPPAGAAKPGDPSVIVVDTPDFDPEAQLTLAEAAKAEKERKAEATPPRIVINNKTIHRYAKGGQITIAEPKKKATPASGSQAAAAAAGTPAALVRDEKYWRGRALEIRQRWRKASYRIKELEEDIGLLRRRFYAQDDPYVRDSQIKPAWDRALDELRESRATAQAAKKELTDFLDEGRIAGALPGWLREGIDLEPKEEKPIDPTQPIETPIYKDNGP